MGRAAVAVCLLVISAGCIVQTGGTATKSPTPTKLERTIGDATTPKAPATPSSSKYDVDVADIERLVHQKMNDRRRKYGVSPLERSEKLDAIARYKSWDMAQRDYFAHEGPEGQPHGYLRNRYQANCRYMSQNLQMTDYPWEKTKTPEEFQVNEEKVSSRAVNSLMNSSGHRKNILNPDYELQGIGIFVDENGTVFLTQEFCG